jgi:hypothetical protein
LTVLAWLLEVHTRPPDPKVVGLSGYALDGCSLLTYSVVEGQRGWGIGYTRLNRFPSPAGAQEAADRDMKAQERDLTVRCVMFAGRPVAALRMGRLPGGDAKEMAETVLYELLSRHDPRFTAM